MRARALHLPSVYRVQLERRGPRGKWAKAVLFNRRRGRRIKIGWRPPAGLESVTLRLRIISRGSGRTLAVSRAVTVVLRAPSDPAGAVPARPGESPGPPNSEPPPQAPPPPEEAEFEVPADTRLYESSEILAVEPEEAGDQVIVEFMPGAAPPVKGGGVALGLLPGLPDGMFARVVDVTESEGSVVALVEQAPLDEVLENVKFDFDGDVTPTVVDEEGTPVSTQEGGAAVLRATASTPRTKGVASSAFECEDGSNVPRDPSEVWDTGLPFPVELVIRNAHALHRFDSGSLLPARDPYFLLQFSGEAIAKVGFQPKTAFTCALSPTFRRNHRLRFRIGTIGPVPVSIYLEPTLEFEVSAAGEVSLEQQHFFSITLEKNGFAAPDFRLAHSADPPTVSLGAKLEASVFAGGDLSVMAGGGYGSANAQAGVFGAFGPEASLSISQDHPGCVDVLGRLRADLGVRFELWVKRWDFQLASLSTEPAALRDPLCVFGASGGPQPQLVTREGDPQPFEFVPQTSGYYLTLPAADGWWLVGEENEESGWQYQWLDPAGNPGATWTSGDQPLSFGRGADGGIIAAMQTPEGDLRLVRFGEDGPESERVEATSPYAPFVQRLANEVGGHIYLFARLISTSESPSEGVFRLDPLTLGTTGYAPLYGDNPGIMAHQAGVTTIDYEGWARLAPYSSFGLHPPAERVIDEPTTHEAAYRQFSVGEGGDVADVDLQSRDCSQLTTSVRHPDGTSWTQPLSALVGEDVPGCELLDLDALPDGGAAYTLRGDDGIYVLDAGPGGDRLSLTQVGPFGLNPTTVVDATGTVVTAFTHRFACEEATGSLEKCSQAVVVGEKAGVVLWSQALAAARQTMMPFTGFVGRPSITIGKNQVGVQFWEVDPNSCESDNCIPYSATASFQTLVEPLEIGLRPSFVWW